MGKSESGVSRAMKVEAWALDRPKPYAGNPRVIPQSAVDKVAASLQRYGWRQPIVVCAKEEIVAGHTRRLAALQIREAGGSIPNWPDTSKLPVHPSGMDEAAARAYRLADNRTGEEAEWDLDLLAVEFEGLREIGLDLDMTGFDEPELSAGDPIGDPPADSYAEQYGVIVICDGEQHQASVFEKLQADGYICRVVVT
jgi:hypothetical protein